MASPSETPSKDELSLDGSPFLRVHKDGRVERLIGTAIVPAGLDPATGVESRDVSITEDGSVRARLYVPQAADPGKKIPLLVYFHGGGFCIESAWSPTYHNYLNALVSEATIVAVSVNYRLAPEHHLPTAYDDSWAAIKWIAAPETDPWLVQFADLNRVYISGDSAGGNIAHHMCIRLGTEPLPGVTLAGAILVDPFFWGEERIGGESARDKAIPEFLNNLWKLAIPSLKSYDHPWINPGIEPERLRMIACERVLVCVAGADLYMCDRGEAYCETLRRSGWGGSVEMFRSEGVGHVFHLEDPASELAVKLMKKVVEFINEGSA
uniref:Alpha/beta hydrolase fold-3 domain-containing protein n=1 Tax=Kalanchoe fedtschenkoi TaxID=63787 RepID=A0A7N0T1M8_KALFE